MTHTTHTTADSDQLSLTFAALADPTRRAMLTRLGQGPATVSELSQPFNISGPAITKHLKVLERAGLVVRSRSSTLRPCHLEPGPLHAAFDWLGDYRMFWDGSLDRLEAYVRTLQAPPEEVP